MLKGKYSNKEIFLIYLKHCVMTLGMYIIVIPCFILSTPFVVFASIKNDTKLQLKIDEIICKITSPIVFGYDELKLRKLSEDRIESFKVES